MGIIFGFKKKNVEEVVEKYNYPVLTSCVQSAVKGSVARFEMNKALIEALSIDLSKDSLVSIGQDDNGNLVLANTTGMETPYQYHVNKDGSVNSGVLHKRLQRSFSDFNPAIKTEFNVTIAVEDELNIAIVNGLLLPVEITDINELPAPPEVIYIPTEEIDELRQQEYFAEEEMILSGEYQPSDAEMAEMNRVF